MFGASSAEESIPVPHPLPSRRVGAPGAAADWPDDCTACGSGIGKRVTPAVLAQAYQLGNIFNGTAKGSMAIAEFTGVVCKAFVNDHEVMPKTCENTPAHTHTHLRTCVGMEERCVIGGFGCFGCCYSVRWNKTRV